MIRIATTQYKLEILPSIQDAAIKLEKMCGEASSQGAKLLLLPEYAGMEWIWPNRRSFRENIKYFQESNLNTYQKMLCQFAIKHQLILVAGSVPVLDEEKYYNRTYVATPTGRLSWQDKIHLTPEEKKFGFLKHTNTLKVFKTDFGVFAVCVCYDSEFPELTTQAIHNGADILLIPSYTDSLHGANRVHIAARCRAMENQCFTVNAVALGKVDCEEFDDLATGIAGIYSPIDKGFPENGILAMKQQSQEPALIIADLDLNVMREARRNGQVHNYQDRINPTSVNIEKNVLS